jgi:phosphoheptose isomerase
MMDDLQQLVERSLENHKTAIEGCAQQSGDTIIAFAQSVAEAFERGNKVMAFGNGGSACDAMHFAGECVGRFVNDRRPLPALALTADPGILTAIGNDYGFETIFERQLHAHAKRGDLVVAISTSGKSPNVLRALEAANALGLQSLLLTGEKGANADLASHIIAVPSSITAHIQETHIWALQLIIAIVENKLFKDR